MATALEMVRSIIADPFQASTALDTGDGNRTRFNLPNAPVKDDSQLVTVDGVTQTEGADYTIDNALGLVTFTAAPASNTEVAVDYQWSILADADLQIHLDLEGADVKLAAAGALDTIASSEALVQKVITLLDLTTNGAAVAETLRAHAVQLREQVASPIAGDDDDPGFEIAEQVYDDFTLRERRLKQWLRQDS